MTNLERASQHVGAEEIGGGLWAHYADETSSWWVVTAETLATLCDYLDDDDPIISRDAYSHWCAAGMATEMPEGWEPSR